MCTVSMVHDHFNDQFPNWPNNAGGTGGWPVQPTMDPASVAEIRKLISDFREAVEAAKKVDLLTKQPDCLDPEKAKLQERVARLEKIIDALLVNEEKHL